MTPTQLRTLTTAREQRRLAVLVTRLADGTQHLLVQDAHDLLVRNAGEPSAEPDPSLLAAARDAAGTGRSVTVEIDGAEWFLQVHAPRQHLVLIGAVHVAQALVRLAHALGMKVSVVDPRAGFATAERFPDIELLQSWPAEALDELRPDRFTAVVSLSHEPRLDDPALDVALRTRAFYVGALGSRKTQEARRHRLAALGHDAAALARLHGPVGLAIGAIGPEEIALSIMAEIVAVRRGAVA